MKYFIDESLGGNRFRERLENVYNRPEHSFYSASNFVKLSRKSADEEWIEVIGKSTPAVVGLTADYRILKNPLILKAIQEANSNIFILNKKWANLYSHRKISVVLQLLEDMEELVSKRPPSVYEIRTSKVGVRSVCVSSDAIAASKNLLHD